MREARAVGDAHPSPGALAAGFNPRGVLANAHVQTIFAATAAYRALQWRARQQLGRCSRQVTLALPAGVRLSGALARQRARRTARGLVVLLHGWLGSIDSNYMVDAAAALLASGWDVFRLNFRDHGGSEGLNRELFHSCLLQEVIDAVALVRRRWGAASAPCLLAGFSLGGNFALRVARARPRLVSGVAAACPVIDPATGLYALEHAPALYRRYFLRAWHRSLRRKQRCFPAEGYAQAPDFRLGLRDLTRVLIQRRTAFGTLERYLDGYSIARDRLAGLRVPALILAARDDPIIPVADFQALALAPATRLLLVAHGGHCGFLRNWRGHGLVADCFTAFAAGLIADAAGAAPAGVGFGGHRDCTTGES